MGVMVGVALGAKVLRVGTLVGAQVGSTVRTASTVAGALWASKLATPIRWALVPFNWFFSMLITGAWVPSGPWMVIWMLLGFASSIQDYKRLFNLTVQLLMHKEGAACKLCDTVIGLMLKFDQNSPEDIDCAELCPFSINACLNVCTKLVHALKESSRYPCLSVGMCPDLDEPPECKLKMPFFACEPSDTCRLVPAFPRPRCELLPGLAVWNKWKSVIGRNVGDFAFALAARPLCSDPGANPNFCVMQSDGLGYCCEVLTLLLVVLAFALSIHALETDGWDDDKQWLTFWIITFCLAAVERLTDVVLSRYEDMYYAAKLLFVVWLVFFRGAERSYTHFRSSFLRMATLLDWIDRSIPQIQMLANRVGVTAESPQGTPMPLRASLARTRVATKVSEAFQAAAMLAHARPAAEEPAGHIKRRRATGMLSYARSATQQQARARVNEQDGYEDELDDSLKFLLR